MSSSFFDIKQLGVLIKEKVKPYTIKARAKAKCSLPIFGNPSNDIQESLEDILRDALEKQEKWELDEFLSLACGFLHIQIWDKIGKIQIPESKSPDNFIHSDIYSEERYYLLEKLPEIKFLRTETYRLSYLFIKNDGLLYFLDYFYNLIPISINSKNLKNLIKKVGDIDESKPLHQTLSQESLLLAEFSELISYSRFEKTIKEIKKTYQEWNKKIAITLGKKNLSARKPGEWLKAVEDNNEINLKINDLLRQLITFRHFDLLDEHKAKQGIDRGIPLNIKQTAHFLTEELGKSITPQQVLDLARQRNTFNAYVNISKFKTTITCNRPSIQDIEDRIAQGHLCMDDKYHFDGLVSLLKNCDNPALGDKRHTIKHLSQGNTIQVRKESPLLCFKPSLSDYIRWGSIIMQMEPGVTKITTTDLLFVEKELQDYVKSPKGAIYKAKAPSNTDRLIFEEKDKREGEALEAKDKKSLKKKSPHELVTIIGNICRVNGYSIEGKRGDPRRLWNYLKNNHAGKENSPISRMTQWTSLNEGEIEYYSKMEGRITRSQKLFMHQVPHIKLFLSP